MAWNQICRFALFRQPDCLVDVHISEDSQRRPLRIAPVRRQEHGQFISIRQETHDLRRLSRIRNRVARNEYGLSHLREIQQVTHGKILAVLIFCKRLMGGGNGNESDTAAEIILFSGRKEFEAFLFSRKERPDLVNAARRAEKPCLRRIFHDRGDGLRVEMIGVRMRDEIIIRRQFRRIADDRCMARVVQPAVELETRIGEIRVCDDFRFSAGNQKTALSEPA